MLLALKDSPLNSAFVVENLCGYFNLNIPQIMIKQS